MKATTCLFVLCVLGTVPAQGQLRLNVPVDIARVHATVRYVRVGCLAGDAPAGEAVSVYDALLSSSNPMTGTGGLPALDALSTSVRDTARVDIRVRSGAPPALTRYACELRFYFDSRGEGPYCVPSADHERVPCRISGTAPGTDPRRFSYVAGDMN